MIPFSYRNLKEQLNKPLGYLELKFLINTFSRACAYFVAFAILIWLASFFSSQVFGNNSWLASCFFCIVGFVFQFPLRSHYLTYKNNPVTVAKPFITSSYTWLVVTFLFMFLGITTFIGNILKFDSTKLFLFIGSIFLVTIFLYMIPVFIAMFLANKKMIISLNKFLGIGFLIYVVATCVSLVTMLFSYKSSSGIEWFVEFLVFMLLLLSPIITIYRLKTVIRYVNHEDVEEVKRWETYFVFEIVHQLLSLALVVMRIAVRLCMELSRSKLR